MKSATAISVNPDWAKLPLFDRSKWKRVRFGEVVENLNETCNPAEAGIERFIGLEHLEPGSLHIRSWGKVADGTTFTRRCRPGQVLFGKRRAYQRKVAVAEFDAVVSGDIYVFAAKEDRLLPELLPFICLSERFFKFAVETSAGSLSPRTNWSHLVQFEFALPPLDQQRRIADILWKMDQFEEGQLNLIAAAKNAADWSRHDHFGNGRSYKLTPMREVGRWVSGNTPSRGRPDYWVGTFPWVSPKDMKQPLISDSEEHLSEAGRKESTEVGPGSLLIVIRGMILAHSFPVGITRREVAFNQDMKAIVPTDSFSAKYLLHWFKWATPKILSRISDSSHGTKRLAMDDLFDMKVPTLSPQQQNSFVERIELLESAGESVHRSIVELKRVRTTFLNHVFDLS